MSNTHEVSLDRAPHVKYVVEVLKSLLFEFETGSQVAQASLCVVEDDHEFLILLPPLPKF